MGHAHTLGCLYMENCAGRGLTGYMLSYNFTCSYDADSLQCATDTQPVVSLTH